MAAQPPIDDEEKSLPELVSMGFGEAEARIALKQTKTVQEAVDLMFSDEFLERPKDTQTPQVPDTMTSTDTSLDPLSSMLLTTESEGTTPPSPRTANTKRMKIVKEIFATELDYVEDLERVVEVFLQPFQKSIEKDNRPIISQENLNTIFSDILLILNLNKSFLGALEERKNDWTEDTTIGDLFVDYAPHFKIYTTYVNKYDTIQELMSQLKSSSSRFNRTLNRQAKKAGTKGDLMTHLIKPIQRIPRYVLLLKALLKSTPKAHNDYYKIKKALGLIKATADVLNESKLMQDNRRQIQQIYERLSGAQDKCKEELFKPSKRLLAEGPLYYRRAPQTSLRQGYIFLFNDSLLITEKKRSILRRGLFSLQYLHFIPMRRLVGMQSEIKGRQTQDPAHGFQVSFSSKGTSDWHFFAKSSKEKADWLSLISTLLDDIAMQKSQKGTISKRMKKFNHSLIDSKEKTLPDKVAKEIQTQLRDDAGTQQDTKEKTSLQDLQNDMRIKEPNPHRQSAPPAPAVQIDAKAKRKNPRSRDARRTTTMAKYETGTEWAPLKTSKRPKKPAPTPNKSLYRRSKSMAGMKVKNICLERKRSSGALDI